MFLHVSVICFFFIAEYPISVAITTVVYPFVCLQTWVVLQFLAIMNKATMNIHVQVFM